MGIRTSFLAVAALVALCRPASAEEHWPGNYLVWPRETVGHPDPCPTCFYLQVYISAGVQPYEPGELFRVNDFGAYVFKTCQSLAAFVNNGILQDDVIPISPNHVMIALRELPYTAGVAHDEAYGDGFIFMASEAHPVSPMRSYIPRGIIRKSSNTRHFLRNLKRGSPSSSASREPLSRIDCK